MATYYLIRSDPLCALKPDGVEGLASFVTMFHEMKCTMAMLMLAPMSTNAILLLHQLEFCPSSTGIQATSSWAAILIPS